MSTGESDAAAKAAAEAAARMAAESNQDGVKLTELVKTNPKMQEELNAMMAANRKKLTTQNQELVVQLEQLKTNATLTTEERDELQLRITQIEEQYLSKEELSKREAGKTQKKFETDLAVANESTDKWKGMYTDSTIDRALQDAAIEAKAVHPSQIVDILKAKTQLAEVLVDGKSTGQYEPVIKFSDKDEDGKIVVVNLSPLDTLKRMKELPEIYGNLFEGSATGGLGESGSSTGGASGKQEDFDTVVNDPVKYAAWRKKNPDLDISTLRRK